MSLNNATDTPSGDEWNGTSICREADTTTSGDLAMSRYRLIVEVYLVGTLCVAGWIGNALSVVVLRRDIHRYKQGTTNWLLQTLAIVDTAFLVTCVLIQPLKVIDIRGGSTWFYRMYPYIEPHAWALASIAQTMTVWIVLLVTVDRYFAVCLPMKNEWRSLRRAKIAVLVVFIAACIYNIPRFFERVVYLEPVCTGEPTPKVRWTSMRNHRVYFLVYKTVCYFIFRSVGPLVTLIALNLRLALELRNVDRRRTALRGKPVATKSQNRRGGSEKHNENLTAMLVGVVTVFIICQLPGLGIRIAYTIHNFDETAIELDVMTLRYANVASNALITFNSAVNIVVYCLVGKRFRRILLDEMLSCCSCGSTSKSSQVITGMTTVCDTHIRDGGIVRHVDNVAVLSIDEANVGTRLLDGADTKC